MRRRLRRALGLLIQGLACTGATVVVEPGGMALFDGVNAGFAPPLSIADEAELWLRSRGASVEEGGT